MTIEVLDDNVETTELKHFFLNAGGYTVFHDPMFLSYHAREKFSRYNDFTFFSLLFINDSKIVGFLPGACYKEGDRKIYKSPFYSSFGGFVTGKSIDFQRAEEMVDGALNFFKEHHYNDISIGVAPSCYFGEAASLPEYFHFILQSKGFALAGSDLHLARPLGTENFNDLDYSIRKQVRQAERSELVFEACAMNEDIYALLVTNRKKFQAVPTHTLEELLKIEKLLPGTVHVFRTMHGKQMVAAAIVFRANADVANTFYLFDDEQFRELHGMQYTYYKVIEWAAENNFKHIDFGSSTFGYTPHHSLIHFKEKFGGKPFLRTTYKTTFD